MLSKAIAFLKKDFLLESSYRFAFFFNFFGILISVLSYYFIDILFGKKIAPQLEAFGDTYFSYVFLGMAFFSFAGTGLSSFAGRVQREQVEGTLESILMTPTGIKTILLSICLWNILVAIFDLLVYIALAAFIFKISFSSINIVATGVILLLAVVSFSGLGLLSASFIVVFKRGNPLGWIINGLEGVLGGVYFPTTVFPQWLQVLAGCLPITYAIRALQWTVYRGSSLNQLAGEVTALCLFSATLPVLSVLAFRGAFRKARRDGTLSQF
jgi:ABC-2 type transport system permease protein